MMSQPLKFQIGPNGTLPTRSYPDDAGFDLYVSGATVIPVDGYADVPTDVRCELPDGVWALIIGRSSTIRTRRLLVTHAVIDTGWRGELFAAVQNVGKLSVHLQPGDRVAQLVPFLNVALGYEPVAVDRLTPHLHGRNENGFGSSGS